MIEETKQLRIKQGIYGPLYVGRSFVDNKVEVCFGNGHMTTLSSDQLLEAANRLTRLARALEHEAYVPNQKRLLASEFKRGAHD